MFTSFYHDSINTFFEVIGEELLNMPMEQFKALPHPMQRSACSAIADHMTYRSVTWNAFHATHERQKIIEFMERAKKAGGFLFKDIKDRFESISEKAAYCLESGIVPIGGVWFTEAYADTRTEFALRELYESQVPFVRWTWERVPAGEERELMAELIRSMERKYLLEIEIRPDG